MKKFSIIDSKINENTPNELYPSGMNREPKTEPEVEKTGAVKLFSKLFESREMANMYHLQVKGEPGSHSKHTALGEYYEGVISLIDKLIEVYMGQYEVIEGYDIIDTSVTKTIDPISYFTEFVGYLSTDRKSALSSDDTHLQNIVDEIVSEVYHLLYKLKYSV